MALYQSLWSPSSFVPPPSPNPTLPPPPTPNPCRNNLLLQGLSEERFIYMHVEKWGSDLFFVLLFTLCPERSPGTGRVLCSALGGRRGATAGSVSRVPLAGYGS